MIANIPDGPVEIPPVVRRLAGAAAIRVVWRNELGGLTFRLGEDRNRRFVKWRPAGVPLDLAGEADRLRWAGRWMPVPEVVDRSGDPTTLIDFRGSWSGHVDLGALGVGDRWADLAIATWSTVWNYGPGWERALLDAYGIAPDPEPIALYRGLWGSVP